MISRTAQQKAMEMIIKACAILKWKVAFRSKDEMVRYLIIGENHAVDTIVGLIDGQKTVPSKKDNKVPGRRSRAKSAVK
jgi:hypothetical protein